jgi:hypothetical protein
LIAIKGQQITIYVPWADPTPALTSPWFLALLLSLLLVPVVEFTERGLGGGNIGDLGGGSCLEAIPLQTRRQAADAIASIVSDWDHIVTDRCDR